MSGQRKRLVIACFCTTALVLSPVVVNSLFQYAQGAAASDDAMKAAEPKSNLADYYEEDSNLVQGLYEQLAHPQQPSRISQVFLEEFFDPSVFGEAQTYEDGPVVGIDWLHAFQGGKEAVVEHIQKQGWEQVGTTPESMNFIKDGGACHWAFLSFSEQADSLSLVITYEKE